MKNDYKLRIVNSRFEKEIELSDGLTRIKIGTDIDCDIRFYKDYFWGTFWFEVVGNDDGWKVICPDNVYISLGDIRKIVSKELKHGDVFSLRDANSDIEFVKCYFLIDFDKKERYYNRIIDLQGVNVFSVGKNTNNDIALSSEYLGNDYINFIRSDSGYQISKYSAKYGVYINGKEACEGDFVNDRDFISIADCSFYYVNNTIRTDIDNTVNRLSYFDVEKNERYPEFRRNTRLRTTLCEEQIEVLDPPEIPKKPKNNLFMRLLPSIAMVGAAIVMGAFMGRGMIVFSLISGMIGVVTGVMSLVESNKEFKNSTKERIETYRNYIELKRKEIENSRVLEEQVLNDIYISQDNEIEQITSFSPNLFDRYNDDLDFGCVRFGSGKVVSKREIHIKRQETLTIGDELQLMPKQIFEEYQCVDNAPIVCDLKACNAVGVVGDENNRFVTMQNMVIDLCSRQFPTDLKLFFIAEGNNKGRIDWLRFLPHVNLKEEGIRSIAYDDEGKSILFEFLFNQLSTRCEKEEYSDRYVIFLYDEYGFRNHPLSKFVKQASDIGVTFIFFGNERRNVMQGCDYIVEIKDDRNGELINTSDINDFHEFTYNAIDDNKMRIAVDMLAPVFAEDISLEGTLTKSISLFEMLDIIAVDDISLEKNWNHSRVDKTMKAPLGVSKNGIVYLDLHDKMHGPHGLVAGTTGSGKSEILQTYVLSMALRYHPYEVGFVIIDFKGGGMANQFEGLPHLLGSITNIDGKEIGRSLKSIKAELKKRQRLFANADVNHIDKYLKKWRSGEVSLPLPHLIIIVDEFAELKAEHPDFMKELISAARIGRSLGVHLILATQKPSGQVDEQIWSNSRFKLCLKVQSQEDSNEVLKSPLAAEIKEAGRAYMQVGNNEVFELFQSAYSGAPEMVDGKEMREFAIYKVSSAGKRIRVYEQKKSTGNKSRTQLEAVVSYIGDYSTEVGISNLPSICLPSLKESIEFPIDIVRDNSECNIIIEIGIFDDPDNQRQGVYSIDLTNNNVMIIGSSQSGKTNLLQTIIRGAAEKYSTKEVVFYIIDFASMVLKNFEQLNHVGGVVTASEDEKLRNLFKLLYGEIELRKEKLLEIGVSSFAAYKEAGKEDLAQIVLIIDNLTALKELYFQDDDELVRLCREGLTVGITVVISNSQTNGIGYKYLSNFSSKIAMYCNDSTEYSSLFEHCRERVDNIAGRCLIEIDKEHLECQAFLSFEGVKEIERASAIRKFVKQINMRDSNCEVQRIPVIPDILPDAFVKEHLMKMNTGKYSIVIGLDYETVSPVVLKLNAFESPLVVTGRDRHGQINAIKYIVHMLMYAYPNMADIYVFDDVKKELADLDCRTCLKIYELSGARVSETLSEIETELARRYDMTLSERDSSALADTRLKMIIINNREILEEISNNASAFNTYKNIVGKYREMNVCVLVGDYENSNISYMAPELIRLLRDEGHFLFFDDLVNMKIVDLPFAVTREYKKKIKKGDCYYLKSDSHNKIKTVQLID